MYKAYFVQQFLIFINSINDMLKLILFNILP